jgi:hypothetical protein
MSGVMGREESHVSLRAKEKMRVWSSAERRVERGHWSWGEHVDG